MNKVYLVVGDICRTDGDFVSVFGWRETQDEAFNLIKEMQQIPSNNCKNLWISPLGKNTFHALRPSSLTCLGKPRDVDNHPEGVDPLSGSRGQIMSVVIKRIDE